MTLCQLQADHPRPPHLQVCRRVEDDKVKSCLQQLATHNEFALSSLSAVAHFMLAMCAMTFAVMRGGEIVEQGSHTQLMQLAGGTYATLVRLQASAQLKPMQALEASSDQRETLSTQPEVVQAYSKTQVSRCDHWAASLQKIVMSSLICSSKPMSNQEQAFFYDMSHSFRHFGLLGAHSGVWQEDAE